MATEHLRDRSTASHGVQNWVRLQRVDGKTPTGMATPHLRDRPTACHGVQNWDSCRPSKSLRLQRVGGNSDVGGGVGRVRPELEVAALRQHVSGGDPPAMYYESKDNSFACKARASAATLEINNAKPSFDLGKASGRSTELRDLRFCLTLKVKS